MDRDTFFDPRSHGFVRLAVAVPQIRVADPQYNAEQTWALFEQAEAAGAALVVFPELGLSAYTCDDLFHQNALLVTHPCQRQFGQPRRGTRRWPW